MRQLWNYRTVKIAINAPLLVLATIGSVWAQTPIPANLADGNGCSKFLLTGIDKLDQIGTLPYHWQAVDLPGVPKIDQNGIQGTVVFSHVASEDLMLDHDWHDVNFYVKIQEPAGPQLGLNSAGNFVNRNSLLGTLACGTGGQPACERLMEMEWDSTYFPKRFWPTAGDRVWMTGRHVWDCGHKESYHTEIHPPTAVAFTRLQPVKIENDNGYSLTNITSIYIHGRGGYFNSSVAQQNYVFNIPAPARPAGITAVPGAWIIEPAIYGGPPPSASVVDPSCTSNCEFTVTYPLALDDPSPDRKFAAIIATGWRNPAGVRYRTFEVTFDEITVRDRHNLLCLADWNMYLNVNGTWLRVDGLSGVNDGTKVTINKTVVVTIVDRSDSILTVQATGWVNVLDSLFGVSKDPARLTPAVIKASGALSQPTSGKVGLFFKQYRAPAFGADNDYDELSIKFEEIDSDQLDGDGKKDAESTPGDFRLKYKIREIH